MQFELFTRKTRRSSVEPLASIQKRGSISLNAAAVKLLKEGRVAPMKKHPRRKNESDFFVELLYNREHQTIALHWALPENPNSFLVRKLKSSDSYVVSAKGFLKHYGIRPGKSKRYVARMHGPDVLVFSLTGK